MFGITNYKPTFYSSIDLFLAEQGLVLEKMIGEKITAIWTVHNTKTNEHWVDCPIVIQLNDNQFEFNALYDNSITITWNSIDLSKEINWFNSSDLTLEWRMNKGQQSKNIIGQKINDIQVLELIDSGFLNGIYMRLENSYLTLFNNLDEAGIRFNGTLSYVKLVPILKNQHLR